MPKKKKKKRLSIVTAVGNIHVLTEDVTHAITTGFGTSRDTIDKSEIADGTGMGMDPFGIYRLIVAVKLQGTLGSEPTDDIIISFDDALYSLSLDQKDRSSTSPAQKYISL
jgi:hypothetical protein